jgi:hypothetical protein
MRNTKKNIKKFKKQYFACQPGPESGYFEKTSIFVFSGDFFGFLWLSLALKNLVKLINSNLDHWNKKNQFSC